MSNKKPAKRLVVTWCSDKPLKTSFVEKNGDRLSMVKLNSCLGESITLSYMGEDDTIDEFGLCLYDCGGEAKYEVMVAPDEIEAWLDAALAMVRSQKE